MMLQIDEEKRPDFKELKKYVEEYIEYEEELEIDEHSDARGRIAYGINQSKSQDTITKSPNFKD